MPTSPMRRVIRECHALRRVLSAEDFRAFITRAVRNASAIYRTRTLTSVDAAMSRNLQICYHGRELVLPLLDIDAILAPHHDNPTFGNVREMYANDSYLRSFHLTLPVRVVLDLGANRGLFSLIALRVLDAEVVVGVEPCEFYGPVMQLLLDTNGHTQSRVIRYNKLIGSSLNKREAPAAYMSINDIRQQQHIARFNMVKIDIEGGERDIFCEADWLSHVDNMTMELHHFAGTLEMIPQALNRYGFRYVTTDQFGRPCKFKNAAFVYASCTGALR
jgi:hypothetical protein